MSLPSEERKIQIDAAMVISLTKALDLAMTSLCVNEVSFKVGFPGEEVHLVDFEFARFTNAEGENTIAVRRVVRKADKPRIIP